MDCVDEMTDQEISSIAPHIFRAYDIRGKVGTEISPNTAYAIGRAIATQLRILGSHQIICGQDGRLSSPELAQAMHRGLRDSGCDVIDIGRVPSPVLYFATHSLGVDSGVMLTGSHNPPEYNGFKIRLKGETLSGEQIQQLLTCIEKQRFFQGEGGYQKQEIIPLYLASIHQQIQPKRALKVVVDCANGMAAECAEALFKPLVAELDILYGDVNGHFPNHPADPAVLDNLCDLIERVKTTGADLGLAFDGDADRLGVVTNKGEVIWPDRLMMLFSRDILKRNMAATIVFDVKCSSNLAKEIETSGGRALMCPTGHSIVSRKLKQEQALLAGEMSGHIFFKERWYGFDDGLYSACRLIEILSQSPNSVSEQFASIPNSVNTPELKVAMDDDKKFDFIASLAREADFSRANIITIDGLRVEYPDGWGLVRASNTTPCLVVRFEADDSRALTRIQEHFRQQLLRIEPGLILPF